MGLGMVGPMYETVGKMFEGSKDPGKNEPHIKQKACTQCGTLSAEEARFCSGCGQSLQVQAEEELARTVHCNDCGRHCLRMPSFAFTAVTRTMHALNVAMTTRPVPSNVRIAVRASYALQGMR